jgi:hypothetical protein
MPAKFVKYQGTMLPAVPIGDNGASGRKKFSWELEESDEEDEVMATMDTD